MEVTFLGTGSSHGIPVIGCNCDICKSDDEKNKRLRSSVAINIKGLNIIIDTGPDFRQQMLREKITRIDAVLLTHEHKDHTAGIDDLRAFNYLMKSSVNVYAEDRVLRKLKQEYRYIFKKDKYPGAPDIDLFEVSNDMFFIENIRVLPIRIFHNKLPIYGYRIENMAYITDVKTISDEEMSKLQDLELLIVSAIRVKPHIAHMGLNDVLELVAKLKPKKVYLTHISHMQYDFDKLSRILPENIFPAYDGLVINL
jgi:phosphoribosyl 1,2-cyclic phosphate phosphodiesterase